MSWRDRTPQKQGRCNSPVRAQCWRRTPGNLAGQTPPLSQRPAATLPTLATDRGQPVVPGGPAIGPLKARVPVPRPTTCPPAACRAGRSGETRRHADRRLCRSRTACAPSAAGCSGKSPHPQRTGPSSAEIRRQSRRFRRRQPGSHHPASRYSTGKTRGYGPAGVARSARMGHRKTSEPAGPSVPGAELPCAPTTGSTRDGGRVRLPPGP